MVILLWSKFKYNCHKSKYRSQNYIKQYVISVKEVEVDTPCDPFHSIKILSSGVPLWNQIDEPELFVFKDDTLVFIRNKKFSYLKMTYKRKEQWVGVDTKFRKPWYCL